MSESNTTPAKAQFIDNIAEVVTTTKAGVTHQRYQVRKEMDGKVFKKTFRTRPAAELYRDSIGHRGASLPSVRFSRVEMEWHLAALHNVVRGRAKRHNVDFDLTPEQMMDLVRRGGGRCAVTGIPFSFETLNGTSRRPWIPSVDRIKAGGPYTVENCRMVCAAVNYAMNEWGTGVLYRIADALLMGEISAVLTGPGARAAYLTKKMKIDS